MQRLMRNIGAKIRNSLEKFRKYRKKIEENVKYSVHIRRILVRKALERGQYGEVYGRVEESNISGVGQ
jgi:hypothetical protein